MVRLNQPRGRVRARPTHESSPKDRLPSTRAQNPRFHNSTLHFVATNPLKVAQAKAVRTFHSGIRQRRAALLEPRSLCIVPTR